MASRSDGTIKQCPRTLGTMYHCEEQIQQLNSKLLESQQQVAVAISTDKKKDIMIEQLDKQLARVVEGWRKRELEKDEYLKVLMKEKGKMEESFQKQQLVQNNFDRKICEMEEKFQSERILFTEQLNTLEIRLINKTLHFGNDRFLFILSARYFAILLKRECVISEESDISRLNI
ncbi:hypothetical protein LOTGIDRAFT_171584 [Lottia gigantea]|uniref:Uncharacterized protein n=1 Tax=Lottia gigantea TaxID=225164 RepID=V4AGR1_LOTGI|nr:hypothetical protein LOTGIDRAFT_171584 [Lottia gigantea]ESP03234.1 hypothetical protein LOTGIDRAFT_171584 [Lottia gigantea]